MNICIRFEIFLTFCFCFIKKPFSCMFGMIYNNVSFIKISERFFSYKFLNSNQNFLLKPLNSSSSTTSNSNMSTTVEFTAVRNELMSKISMINSGIASSLSNISSSITYYFNSFCVRII